MSIAELFAFLGRHPLQSLLLSGITAALIVTEIRRLASGFKRVGPAQVTALMNREDAVVIDIRPAAEFKAGHIPNSRHIPAAQLAADHKQLAHAKALPVVLVCKTGQTAAAAAKPLLQAGFEKVHVLEGGITAWQQADLPLAKAR